MGVPSELFWSAERAMLLTDVMAQAATVPLWQAAWIWV